MKTYVGGMVHSTVLALCLTCTWVIHIILSCLNNTAGVRAGVFS